MLKLRAHHLCCLRFVDIVPEGCSPEFRQTERSIKEMLLSAPDAPVMVIEGTDGLCRTCPVYVDGRCESPQGNEEEVRKYDAILLKELGASFGDCLTAGEWQALVQQKTPFKICHKCKTRGICSVGSGLS